ncbi:MAG TPA: hypothetical protein P5134_03795, partial [Bacteroidales bacterium]|nr:hypothetical protein [Bacteroidales bacterium]
GKKATLEALFAALRPHGLRPRTWNRRPTPSVARGHALKKMMIIIFTFIKKKRRTIVIDTSLFLLKINIFIGH